MVVQKDRRRAAPAEAAALAASVAHEINNPLQSLRDFLYLIECETGLSPKGRRYLALAQEEINRVSQIATQSLSGFRDSCRRQRANVPELVGSVLEFYQPRFEARGIAIETLFCDDGDLVVYPGPLRQLISNLLLNAADAMPEGGRLRARVSSLHERSAQQRRGLLLTIADTGCGISAENLPKLAEPFFSTKGLKGSGLGLPLVHDVVRKHRGWMRVRSSTAPGRSGSVFAVFLPCD